MCTPKAAKASIEVTVTSRIFTMRKSCTISTRNAREMSHFVLRTVASRNSYLEWGAYALVSPDLKRSVFVQLTVNHGAVSPRENRVGPEPSRMAGTGAPLHRVGRPLQRSGMEIPSPLRRHRGDSACTLQRIAFDLALLTTIQRECSQKGCWPTLGVANYESQAYFSGLQIALGAQTGLQPLELQARMDRGKVLFA